MEYLLNFYVETVKRFIFPKEGFRAIFEKVFLESFNIPGEFLKDFHVIYFMENLKVNKSCVKRNKVN